MQKPALILVALLASTVLGGCATSKSPDVYSREQAMQELTVRMGVLEAIREVALEGTRSGIGTGAGAVVGGVAGSTMGQGKGQIVGAVLGAVVGGLVGSGIESQTTKKIAVELTVRLDSGKTVAIVQEGDGREFRAGDRVRVLSGRGETRVTR